MQLVAFQDGYDFRFSLAQSIPVIVTDLLIRLIWSLRRYFQFKKPLRECIPTQSHADLRVMLILGNGTLCVMDGIDAGIRANGNALRFFMREFSCLVTFCNVSIKRSIL